ncbi:malonyl-ACP O-methyltransferase BioC [Ectothiorhodospira marina]|jgi:malonyl-CoA O-methyltransferase|uniref:Malonyl-[acyl-carrier protein] O-methyltransferase n=1 Tax=Ectothiorhodospira marina TaxID=1396821 RepID=A0A1H7RAK8_9GAMM|nr:malonyl-ACP O-methyltransferase BioC [Ectothiorhodospira marina]SEL56477.1 malonyl-CoA O-methyltransferase [Ectothiorhodospira marina]
MTDASSYRLDKRRVRATFDQAAASYDEAAVLQREVCSRLLERLQWVKLDPARVLDAGAGTGQGARGLRRMYRGGRVVALDLSPAMLRATARGAGWWRKPGLVCADVESLPFAEASFDLIFSSLTVQWCNDLDRALAEFRRVLAPQGLLMFTTLGPDTLVELRRAWEAVDGCAHVNAFMDMHDIGDALVRAGFADPVMDVERMTVTYPDVRGLMRDLKAIGATNALSGRGRGLTSPGRLRALETAYEEYRQEGLLPASYEVVFGHAWVPDAPAPSGLPEGVIPIQAG